MFFSWPQRGAWRRAPQDYRSDALVYAPVAVYDYQNDPATVLKGPASRDRPLSPLVVRREAELAPVPHLGRPRLELGRDAHLVHVVPLLAGDVEAAARWVVGDAVEHEAVRRPPRTDLLGEQVSSGEGATGRGLRSPAWSNYSSPTPGLAHAS